MLSMAPRMDGEIPHLTATCTGDLILKISNIDNTKNKTPAKIHSYYGALLMLCTTNAKCHHTVRNSLLKPVSHKNQVLISLYIHEKNIGTCAHAVSFKMSNTAFCDNGIMKVKRTTSR